VLIWLINLEVFTTFQIEPNLLISGFFSDSSLSLWPRRFING